MAHWIDKKQKTRVSDTDYNILSLGKKKTIDNTFGLSSRDYIEMNVFNSSGTFLESIRIDEPKQYVNVEGKFEINPGIILRRNGYFSGDYDIEFNFFREIAGSNQTILVDSNKKTYLINSFPYLTFTLRTLSDHSCTRFFYCSKNAFSKVVNCCVHKGRRYSYH